MKSRQIPNPVVDREMPRESITLACTDCKARNYTVTKNKSLHPERVEVKKFCPRCGKHVLHRESR